MLSGLLSLATYESTAVQTVPLRLELTDLLRNHHPAQLAQLSVPAWRGSFSKLSPPPSPQLPALLTQDLNECLGPSLNSPPSSQETHHWGLWDHRPCRRHSGQGQGLLPEVAALPSEVQEVGVSEASSGPDCLGGAGQWRVRGLAAAAPSSPASHQLGGLDVWAGKCGWGVGPLGSYR